MWDYLVFWDEAMNQARKELGEPEFSLWFNIKYSRSMENGVVIQVPSSFYREQFAQKYKEYVEGLLYDLAGMEIGIELEIVKPVQSSRPRSRPNLEPLPSSEGEMKESSFSRTPSASDQRAEYPEVSRSANNLISPTVPVESSATSLDESSDYEEDAGESGSSEDEEGFSSTDEPSGTQMTRTERNPFSTRDDEDHSLPEHMRILRRMSLSSQEEERDDQTISDTNNKEKAVRASENPQGKLQSARQPAKSQGSERNYASGYSREQAEKETGTRDRHPQLRADYNFETFVVGENNKFAASAALAIVANPGSSYNPFLIYGGVGLGKTHLMQSIGNKIWQTNQKARILCITAEEFTNEFIQTIHDKTTHSFKNKYRNVDILLIDDIHFLQNKPGVQEELFHTFNSLYDSNKQMVFTCDRPVSELKNLSDRLRSRFERGLNVDLQPPEFETRCAILRRKVMTMSTSVPDEVISVVAKNISTNVRDLEAALTKLVAYAALVHKNITLEIAQNQLKDVFSQSRQGNITIDTIIKTVADHFKLSYADIKGKKRTKNIVFPRQVAMYIAREMTEYSTTEIGMEFGGRDHTTVMHGCQKIEERLKLDPALDSMLQSLIRGVKDSNSR